MAADPLELRLQFLSRAANVLAIPAPTASANLGAAHRALITANDMDLEMQGKELDAMRRSNCGGCGSVMVPGMTCRVSVQSERQSKKAQSKAPKKEEPRKKVVYTCSRCDRKTAQVLPSRPPKHMSAAQAKAKSSQAPQPASTAPLMEQENKVAKSVNATSKQRKKARKGGLQAMLDKSKASTPSPGGLDLMDFLQ